MLTLISITDPRVLKQEEKTQIAVFYKSQSFKNKALIRVRMMMKIAEADILTMPAGSSFSLAYLDSLSRALAQSLWLKLIRK